MWKNQQKDKRTDSILFRLKGFFLYPHHQSSTQLRVEKISDENCVTGGSTTPAPRQYDSLSTSNGCCHVMTNHAITSPKPAFKGFFDWTNVKKMIAVPGVNHLLLHKKKTKHVTYNIQCPTYNQKLTKQQKHVSFLHSVLSFLAEPHLQTPSAPYSGTSKGLWIVLLIIDN